MNQTVAVFGATGAQGAPVVREALAKGLHVRAVARDTARITAMHPKAAATAATLDDEASLVSALTDVDAAFVHLPTPNNPEDPARWMQNLFAAAHKAALPLLVFSTTGTAGARYPSATLIDANTAAMNAVLSSGIPAIVLHPTIYLENIQVELFVPDLKTKGVLDYPPLPKEHTISWTSHLDQARIAAAALTRPDLAGQAFEIASHGALTGEALARSLEHWAGRPVSFEPATPEEFGNRIGAIFQSPPTGYLLTELYSALAAAPSDIMQINTPHLEEVFGVKLQSADDHIAEWQ